MQKRWKILLLGIAAVVLLAVLWPDHPPLHLLVRHVESVELVDDAGNKMRLWTLSITNTDSVWLDVERHPKVEFKSGGDWVATEQKLDFGHIPSGRSSAQELLLPASATTCRLRVNYRTEPWRARLLQWLGDSGRGQLIRLPWLAKLLWTDQWNRFPEPPRWSQAKLTVDAPLHPEAELRELPRDVASALMLHGKLIELRQRDTAGGN